MNIKLKAALTVLGFLAGMVAVAWGIMNIPPKWVSEYGGTIMGSIMVIGSLVFAYYIALDHYKDVEEIKKMDEQTKRKIKGQNSRLL